MSYYTALLNKWPSVQGADLAAKLAALDAETVAGPNIDVAIGDIVGYLAIGGKIAPLQDYAASTQTVSNKNAVDAARTFFVLINTPRISVMQTSVPSVYAAVQGFLSTISADAASGITTNDVQAILGMAATTMPWWQANGYSSPIGTGDLEAAGITQ